MPAACLPQPAGFNQTQSGLLRRRLCLTVGLTSCRIGARGCYPIPEELYRRVQSC